MPAAWWREAGLLAVRIALLLALSLAVTPVVFASHSDGTYELPVWFQWGRRSLDVLIVPPGHGQLLNGDGVLGGEDPATEANPLTNSYMQATRDSVANWQLAIDTYAPTWLKTRLVINVYELADAPTLVPTGYDIVIVSDEWKANILGVAVSGTPCIVDNSKLFTQSFTYEDFFNINAQEYGHCLGLSHVEGDHPQLDAMNGAYPHNPGASGNPLHCVSNLDVKALEGVFATAMGQPGGGQSGVIAVSQYQQKCL